MYGEMSFGYNEVPVTPEYTPKTRTMEHNEPCDIFQPARLFAAVEN